MEAALKIKGIVSVMKSQSHPHASTIIRHQFDRKAPTAICTFGNTFLIVLGDRTFGI
jgi:hypothetical protein